jgi:hypothetical protein
VRLALAAVLLVCCTLAGQQQRSPSPVSRTIEGLVFDRAGHPVAGAVVLIEDLKSLQVRSYIVQEDGKFRFRGLSADANYEVRARFNGMASKPKTISVFESKPVIEVNLTLIPKRKRNTPAQPPSHTPGNPS